MSWYQLDDTFIVEKIDPDGKFFDKVSRIDALGEKSEMRMLLDVATDIYPMKVNEKFKVVLVSTLNLDGTEDTGRENYTQAGNLADDMSCEGSFTIFLEDASSPEKVKLEIHASFGGLLMVLKGDRPKDLKFKLEQRLFLLMRKE